MSPARRDVELTCAEVRALCDSIRRRAVALREDRELRAYHERLREILRRAADDHDEPNPRGGRP
jgi:hypothetical protein